MNARYSGDPLPVPVMARVRLWRFVKWYRRLRRDPLADEDYFRFQLPRGFALRAAWHWSSDMAVFLSRGPR